MLTTTKSTQFLIEIQDSTVVILPGTARIGNSVYSFMGARTTYANMLDFGLGDSSMYQNVLLYLDAPTLVPNLTSVVSAPVPSQTQLSIPAMPIGPSDSSYASGCPISLFTLFSPDGTQATLIDYTK